MLAHHQMIVDEALLVLASPTTRRAPPSAVARDEDAPSAPPPALPRRPNLTVVEPQPIAAAAPALPVAAPSPPASPAAKAPAPAAVKPPQRPAPPQRAAPPLPSRLAAPVAPTAPEAPQSVREVPPSLRGPGALKAMIAMSPPVSGSGAVRARRDAPAAPPSPPAVVPAPRVEEDTSTHVRPVAAPPESAPLPTAESAPPRRADSGSLAPLQGRVTEEVLLTASWGATLRWLVDPSPTAYAEDDSDSMQLDAEALSMAPWAETLAVLANLPSVVAEAHPAASGVSPVGVGVDVDTLDRAADWE